MSIQRIADRRRDTELSARNLMHSGLNDPQLKFADAALHAEQQAIIRLAAIEIDGGASTNGAQLEQMMPIAPMRASRKISRHITAQTCLVP
jgi:hypothetical protein